MKWRLGGLWGNPDFRRLWAAHTVSQFGSRMTALALPLVAALTLGASPFEVGLLAAAETAPVLLVGLAAGVWVDRRPRLPILIRADVGRAVLLLAIPLAAWLGALSMELLYAVALLVGTLTVFFDVAAQSLLPAVVGREHLVEGNSRLQSSYGAAEVAGPGLAGVLVGAFSAPAAILVDAASYAASALLLGRMRITEARPTREARRGLLSEIGEGLRLVARDPILRTLAASTGIGNLFDNARLAMLVLFLTRELDLGPGAVGLVFAGGSAGYLLGTLLPAPAARRFGLGHAIAGSLAAIFLGGLVVALAGGSPGVPVPLVVAGLAVDWGAAPVYDANQVSLRQAITPDRVRGRVNASLRVLIRGTVPLGALLGGAVAELVGLRATLLVSLLGPPASFLLVWFSPVRALREPPEAPSVAGLEATG